MAKKALNKTNLVALGADTLADLLLEAVKGDAARARRVRMALASDAAPQETAAEIRKRFASIRRARGFLSAPAQKSLVRELGEVMDLIETRVAPDAPDCGSALNWHPCHYRCKRL